MNSGSLKENTNNVASHIWLLSCQCGQHTHDTAPNPRILSSMQVINENTGKSNQSSLTNSVAERLTGTKNLCSEYKFEEPLVCCSLVHCWLLAALCLRIFPLPFKENNLPGKLPSNAARSS